MRRPAIVRAASLAALALCTALVATVLAGEATDPARFSTSRPGDALPGAWKVTALPGAKKLTRYTLVDDAGQVVLRADAAASMASVTHPLTIDATHFPMLEWRWKITALIGKSDLHRKELDDFPARVYVVFDYDIRKLPFTTRTKLRLARVIYGPDVPAAALCYVWDGKLPVGFSAWSSYTDRVRIIVAESGADNVGHWIKIRRNVAEDFRAAFGEEAPPISGVVLATDTDNTSDNITAWYGDVRFLKVDVGE